MTFSLTLIGATKLIRSGKEASKERSIMISSRTVTLKKDQIDGLSLLTHLMIKAGCIFLFNVMRIEEDMLKATIPKKVLF